MVLRWVSGGVRELPNISLVNVTFSVHKRVSGLFDIYIHNRTPVYNEFPSSTALSSPFISFPLRQTQQ